MFENVISGRLRMAWCGVLAAAVVCAAAETRGATGDGYVYYYFDEPISLTLDRGRLAVFAAGRDDAAAGCLKCGVEVAGVEATPVPGVSLVQLAKSQGADAEVEEAAAKLAGESAFVHVSPVFIDGKGDPVIITRTLLVGFEPGVESAEVERILAENAAGEITERDWAGLSGVYKVRCATRNGFEALATANRLARSPQVRFAEPDMLQQSRQQRLPNDPLFGDQWGLHNTGQAGGVAGIDMGAAAAFEITRGDPNIAVAVLDNGIQLDHPDLGPLDGADFTELSTGGGPDNPCDNHGTLIAGCIAARADNGIGVAGIAPECTVLSAKYGISNEPCNGTGWFMTSWLVDAIVWSQTAGASVTSNSNAINQLSAVTTAYQDTYDAGMMHVASSGNYGINFISYPASLGTVMAVGAIDRTGQRASFSSYGSALAVVAPGVDVLTTDRSGADGEEPGDYAWSTGTSFATPYAAGAAALVLSVDPSLTPAEVEALLRDSAYDLGAAGFDIQYGAGLVRVERALLAAGGLPAFEVMLECLSGPEVFESSGGCSAERFEVCDLAGDGDVDLRDLALYQAGFGG